MKLFLAILVWLTIAFPCYASLERPTVYFAGVSYAGSNSNIEKRFRYSRRFELQQNSLADAQKDTNKKLFGQLRSALLEADPKNFEISFETSTVNGNDQVVMLSLVIGNEIVSTEKIGGDYRLFIQVRGQVLFFDIKAMKVLKSYPVSFSYLDVKHTSPTEEDIDKNIEKVFRGAENKPGIISRFASAAATAQFSQIDKPFLQVVSASIEDSSRNHLPESIRSANQAEEWLADLFAESISKQLGVPILPYKKNDVIGKMQLRLSDGGDYSLEIPSPNYVFKINLLSLKRITDKETDAAISYVYGSVANVILDFPIMGREPLNSKFRYGMPVVMPKSDLELNDEAAFSESIQGLFDSISMALKGEGSNWVKQNSLQAPNSQPIQIQISSSAEMLKKCK